MNAENADNSESRGKLHCPRCGYDLRGVVQAWEDACPLEGTCAECGLGFEWSKVLRPEFYEPQWCVEFAPRGVRPFIGSCVKTMVRTLWPWAFWKRMNMALEVRWRRLAGYLGMLLLMLAGVYLVQQALVAVQLRRLVQQNLAAVQAQLPGYISGTESQIAALEVMEFAPPNADGEQRRIDASGGPFWIETKTERDQALKRARAQIARAQQFVGMDASDLIDQPMWRAIFEAVCTPWSISSAGTLNDPWIGASQYPAPREMHMELINQYYFQRAWRGGSGIEQETLTTWKIAGSIGGAYFLLMPVLFVLLPMSRRRARVQWKHVWRATAYSVAIPIIGLLALICLLAVSFIVPGAYSRLMQWSRLIVFIPSLLLLAWWATAMGRYMKIPHGWFVAIVFAVLTVLLVGSGGFLLSELW